MVHILSNQKIPDFITHYYEAGVGPFRNLSDLPDSKAKFVLACLRKERKGLISKRPLNYMALRRETEERLYSLFVSKGGIPKRKSPHYFCLGECDGIQTHWYKDGRGMKIHLSRINPEAISFTYSDSMLSLLWVQRLSNRPLMKKYHGQVFTLQEIGNVIEEFGWPRSNEFEGNNYIDEMIEAQLWDDEPIERFT